MRITAQEFIGLVRRQGIKCDIHKGQLRLTGGESDMLNKLRAVLRDNPSLAQGVKEHTPEEDESLMTAREFLRECENAGIVLQIDAWTYDISMAGVSEKAQRRLCKVLEKRPELKARVVLLKAMKDTALMDSIEERACIRWSEGYSDSLYMAVLSNLTETGEEVKKDANGQIILRPRSDMRAELARL